MRSFLFSFLIVSLVASCGQGAGSASPDRKGPYARTAEDLSDTSHFTTIEWKEKTIDFGRIDEGEKLDLAFHFTNTGKFPLVISKVEPSCGCTMAEVPKEPIAPGQEGVIKGSFNSSGRAHANHKTLYVYANAKGTQPSELSFDVDVQPKN